MKKTIMREVNGKFVPVSVEMDEDEISTLKMQVGEAPEPDATPEERLDALETTTDDMILIMADLIGGN